MQPEIAESDLITINYTSGTTSRPKGVMITHRNAWVNAVGTLVHHPMTQADRYLWTLPMFHANGWTFVWTVTAVGGTHVCLRKVDARGVYRARRTRSASRMLCAAPTVLIGDRQCAGGAATQRAARRARAHRGRASCGGHDRAHRRRARLDDHPRVRPDRDRALHHDLRAAPEDAALTPDARATSRRGRAWS